MITAVLLDSTGKPMFTRSEAMPLRLTEAQARNLGAGTKRRTTKPRRAVGSGFGLIVKRSPRGSSKFTVPGPPVPKPRQTQSDKWNKRPVVMRYRAWADLVQAIAPTDIGEPALTMNGVCLHATFYLPMPQSWPKSKRDAMRGTRHLQKPDLGNLMKALEDAMWPLAGETDDSVVWQYDRPMKLWDDGQGPRTVVEWSNRCSRTPMRERMKRCEVCNEPINTQSHSAPVQLCGCEKCGRLFGPCCNSVAPNYCVECVE